jgi:hypothetical protein
MINPFPRAKELYQEYVNNSVTCDMKPSWDELDNESKFEYINAALEEYYNKLEDDYD